MVIPDARRRKLKNETILLPVSSDRIESEKITMANVYVEARPKGRPEGSHIDDYVVERARL